MSYKDKLDTNKEKTYLKQASDSTKIQVEKVMFIPEKFDSEKKLQFDNKLPKELWLNDSEKVGLQQTLISAYANSPTTILSMTDILALSHLESNFTKGDKSSGSIGLMQVMKIAVKDLVEKYDAGSWFDTTAIDGFFSTHDIDGKFVSGKQGLTAVVNNPGLLLNPELNALIGVNYCKVVEKYFSMKSDLSFMKTVLANKSSMAKRVKQLVGGKGVALDNFGSNFETLWQKLRTDKEVQQRFAVLRRYNGDSKIRGRYEKISHKNYYATTALYMSMFNQYAT